MGQPLMHSVSDPHIISHLPGAGNISDNSKGHKSYNQSQRSNKHLHQNPNYRLSQSNNLSNIPHPHHHFNDDDEDIRHSPRAHQVFHGIKEQLTGHSKVDSHSTTSDTNNTQNNMHTIIEVEANEIKVNEKKQKKKKQQQKNKNLTKIESDAQKKHVYKSSEKKRRAHSVECSPAKKLKNKK